MVGTVPPLPSEPPRGGGGPAGDGGDDGEIPSCLRVRALTAFCMVMTLKFRSMVFTVITATTARYRRPRAAAIWACSVRVCRA